MDLTVEPGEVVAVLGPNGAGKSTLLAMVSGLLRPDEGTVTLGDRLLSDAATGVFVPAHRRRVALLAQQALLFPHLSVESNVGFGPRSRGAGRAQARAEARTWLRAVDAEHLADRRPSQLSGGQAQRIAIARALACDPELLLLDEPMSALDVSATPQVRRLLREILRERRRSALLVTHDLLDALALADTAVVIEDGRVVERGDVRRVLTAPQSRFGARIAGVNVIGGTVRRTEVLETSWGSEIYGLAEDPVSGPAVAVFAPSAVAVHGEPPHGSPRNVLAVTIATIDVHGHSVRLTGADNPDGSTGLAAEITPAALADLDLVPGQQAYFAVKAQEVRIHPAT
ncbi:ATP-binding cassette domain-containing protein [Aldersonia sp. NBC_00410]|uniref:sulfate/molybdate ABC transporter ATP-binding protein n=1 Tax=Aldersonia sp. NBC_00410 TaxID=2975954 RepID=UPI00225AAD9C|nr:ATP-binding cassette domain-containing protein [Aldersonia sp. NBC_00410]MCX5046510.1 ATP-binding cassette domain-containing protein [Aldersonia sp. NBC_00410]